MPTVFKHGPFRFFFYSNEGDPREPMHVHVRAGASEAKIWIGPDLAVAKSAGFNSRALKDILAIVATHRIRIEQAWHDHFSD